MENNPVDKRAYNLRLVDVAEEPRKLLLPIAGYEQMPLKTLEEAIAPIADLLPDIEQKVYIAKYNSENPKGGLTVNLSAAIMLYTMGKASDNQPLYYVLNSILRSNQSDRSEKLEPWFLYLKLFITALSYLPSYRGTVYRGVKCDMSDYYTIGKTFVWWGFSSCTKSLGVLQSELFLGQQGVGTLFIIECFSGKEIRYYSQYEKEDEVLLVAARQFIVVDRLNPKSELWIIQVKEIDPPFQFLKTESSISSALEMTRIDDDDTNSANICSKCSKIISNISVSNAETNTDDLPCHIEQTLSDEQLNANADENDDKIKKSKNEEGSPNTTSVLINSDNANFGPSGMPTTSNFDTLVPAETDQDNSSVKTMFFKNKLITEELAKTIAESIRQNAKLEILYFYNNGLKDAAFHYIIQAIIGRSSLTVFINDNKITDQSATLIAEILSHAPNAISQLKLERNQLTAVGVKSIVQVLSTVSNSSLRALSFSGNQCINDACIDDIIHLFNENRTLRSLYLEKCSLSDAGKERLRLAMSNKTVFFLQL
jgi:hypothetical protein